MMQNNRIKKELSGILQNLRRFALSLTGDRQDADDLLQETVIRIMEKGAPDDADMRKWAFRVCKNLWFDTLRSRKVRRNWVQNQSETQNVFEDGVGAMDAKMALKEVHTIMEQMPEEQRLLLTLVAVEGCSYREAAEIVEVPIGTVMSRVSRARAFLNEKIHDGDNGPETDNRGTLH